MSFGDDDVNLAYHNTGICAYQVPMGQNVNQVYYRTFLMDILWPAIRKKWKTLLEVTPLILQDNSACHKSQRVTSLLMSYNWNALPHPVYSQDMRPSPPQPDLFPKLKKPLHRVHYYDLDDLELEMARQVRHMNSGCLATGIGDVLRKWESVIRKKGSYIEGN